MNTAYNAAPIVAPAPHTGVLATIGEIFSMLDRSIAAANVYEALSHLSDAQLAQRGLTRLDIASVAVKVLLDKS